MLHPIVLAADGGYAMPLAVTLRSITETNRNHWPIEFWVFNDGFCEELRKKVFNSLPEGSALILWLPVELKLFEQFSPGYANLSKLTYVRFLAPRLLPPEISRILYLDVDLLILDDLEGLWQTDLAGAPVGAVADLFLHTTFLAKGLDPQKERANHFRYGRGLPSVEHYLNAGVLLIDLDRWRAESLSERAFDYLKQHPDTPHMDQDALNAVLDKRWTPLPARWNVQDHYRRIVPGEGGPGIVHFITRKKPWLATSRSANARLYDSFRSRTLFRRRLDEKVKDTFIRFEAGIKNVLKRRGLKLAR
jgi:lipopolysaccharide biosynthesis glycosyltransferase